MRRAARVRQLAVRQAVHRCTGDGLVFFLPISHSAQRDIKSPFRAALILFFHFLSTIVMIVSSKKWLIGAVLSLSAVPQHAFAQGGIVGIDAATSSLTSYVDPISTLILAIGAVVGLIGGVRVYIKWNSGDRDINKELMSWGGSCLFLVLVSVVIKAFFGV